MPLIPRDFGGEVEVEIDSDTYWLRRELGWYHREKASRMKGVAIHVRWQQVKEGDIKIADSETVPITMDATEEVSLQRLLAWLTRWSHTEAITNNTVKRLPMRHARLLLARIDELEAAQDGPGENSPLPVS